MGVSVSSASSVLIRRRAPITLIREESSAADSSGPIGMVSVRSTSPVSIPGSIWKVVMPVSLSPRMMAHAMGAAPRWRGSPEPWTLMEPRLGTSSTALGSIWPKATTTATSASSSRNRSGHPGSRSRGGCRTGRPAASARCFTGESAICRPRPAGLSGWGTAATTLCRSRRASSVGTANSGVPENKTFKLEGESARSPLLGEAVLLDPLLDPVTRQRREMIDEEDPVEMVHLVLDDARLHARGLEVDGLAILVGGVHRDGLAALDVGVDPGKGKTAFLVDH